MKRTFKDLVPRSGSLRKRLRQVLSGGAIAGMGVTPVGAIQDPVTPAADSSTVTIVNRAAKAKNLILQLPSGVGYRMLQHRSHSSHSSHKSHSSHYSGSSGGASRPAPIVTPSPAPARRVMESPPPTADLEALSYFDATIDTINIETRTITVKHTETKLQYTLGYRDDTTIRSLLGTEARLDDTIEKNKGAFPLGKGQKVKITWKHSTNGKTIAVTIAHIK